MDADDARCSGVTDMWEQWGLEAEVVQTPSGGHVIANNPEWKIGLSSNPA